MKNKWTQADMPDLTGKIAVVTGANSGLGYESAKALAKKGATVIMAVRNLAKGEQAQVDIRQEVPAATLDVMQADMGDLSSIKTFSEDFKAKYDRLDILLNNAGLMAIPRQTTADGFEMQLGVNHLGHFALTGHLLDVIVKTPQARIHNVTSSANFMGNINFDDLMGEEDYGRWTAYGQSKLANVLFTFELNKRLQQAGYDTIANVSHPGLVIGNLQANSMHESGTGNVESIFYALARPIMSHDISMGILPMLYAMTAENAKGGVMYAPRYFNHRGYPAEKKPNKSAYDKQIRRRFWDVSAELTHVHYEILEKASV